MAIPLSNCGGLFLIVFSVAIGMVAIAINAKRHGVVDLLWKKNNKNTLTK